MKKFYFVFLFSVLFNFLNAEKLPEKYIKQVASNFYSLTVRNTTLTDVTPNSLRDVLRVYVPHDGIGYVVTTCDDDMMPIVAYSADGIFPSKELPDGVKQWFEDIKQIAKYTKENKTFSKSTDEWNRLYFCTQRKDETDSINGIVGPLLTTKWNQEPLYNALCPMSSNDSTRCPAGCAAVAMGQIMKYWNYPATGRGFCSYELDSLRTLSVNLDSSHYDWINMPDSLTFYSTDTQINAIAKLLSDIGISLSMKYADGSSGAIGQSFNQISMPCMENAFRSNFKYSHSLRALNYETVEINNGQNRWESIMKEEILSGRPLVYTGTDLWASGGHAFVVDGLDSTSYSEPIFHANFGWGGQYDGYFCSNYFNPWYYDFLYYRTIIVGIEPAQTLTDTVIVEAYSSDSSMGFVTGAGTYSAYNDTVYLMANAREGYKFVKWSDECCYNPRIFIPNEDCEYTAIFSPINDIYNELSYALNYSFASLQTNNMNYQWGVRYPAASLPRGVSLDKINVKTVKDGNYRIAIYQGGNDGPDELIYSQDTYIRSDYFSSLQTYFNCLELNRPVEIDTSKSLWITLMADSANACCTFYCGNMDGMWVRGEDGWYSLNDSSEYYTWSIGAVFSGHPLRTVTAKVDIPIAGNINGVINTFQRSYHIGDTCTLMVTCFGTDSTTGLPYVFQSWSNGSTDNPYRFAVDSNISLIAHIGLGSDEPESIDMTDDTSIMVYAREKTIVVDCGEMTAQVTVFDNLGRTLFQKAATSATIDVPTTGVYHVRIVNAKCQHTYKVLCR